MIAIVRALGFLVLTAGCAHACDCLEPPMDANYARATHVFYGEVTDAGTHGTPPKGATFRVTQWFKGPKQDPLSISLAAGGTDCDLYFRVGEKWLIFAQGKPLSARQCGGSRLLEPGHQGK